MVWKIIACFFAYAFMSLLSYGGLTATDQYSCHNIYAAQCTDRMVKIDNSRNVQLAIIPPGWFAAFFITNMYEDGLVFKPVPHVK